MTEASPHAVWLSTPHQALVEIANGLGARRFVLEIEHGYFKTDATDKLVALIRALGSEVYAKVLGPETTPIQQALDIGTIPGEDDQATNAEIEAEGGDEPDAAAAS